MSLRVAPADGAAGLARFVDVPWRLYGGQGGRWIPPLRLMVRQTLDRGRDPFWRSADRALFVATRGGRAVGRIAAIENRAHNAHHDDRIGFFGFFECADEPEAARALLDKAGGWLRARGLTAMRGPMSPSINHECGLLVEGHEAFPVFFTPWNPAHYGALLEGAGLVKERDLLAFWFSADPAEFELPPVIARAAERARARIGRLTFEDLDGPRLMRDAPLCREIFNEAWRDNWGFVPLGPHEFDYLTRELRPIVVTDMSFLALVDGEPAGFMVVVRDLNRVLERIPSGRLLPTGIFKLLTGTRAIRHGRVILLGVRERWRGQHILPLFVEELLRRGREFGGVGAEASWILEDNDALLRPLAAMGAVPYRRWRIYQKAL